MITVKLATGETIECFNVERGVGSDLIIQTDKLTFAEAGTLFGNRESLAVIVVSAPGEESIYYGYQTLAEIKTSTVISDEALMIVLRK